MEQTLIQQALLDEFKIYVEKCTEHSQEVDRYMDFDKINATIAESRPEIVEPNILDFTNISEYDILVKKIKETEILKNDAYAEGGIMEEQLAIYHDFLVARKFTHAVSAVYDPDAERLVSKNIIVFGAPGTGKSFYVKNYLGSTDENTTRITFHPDTDYSTFVGCYKPCKSETEDVLTYEFVPQAFSTAYVNAWKQDSNVPYFLMIEEINRGNCAQIFGDIFQLLDRGIDGLSDYSITPDKDLQKYLAGAFERVDESVEIPEEIKSGKIMRLPKNLYILATMNTSDQSLFPIDSAFKRRWEWKYIPIKDEKKGHRICINGRLYDWGDFLAAINTRIEKVTDSEDKQLGYWFVKVDGTKKISASTFVSKVLFYLWADVFKDYGKDGSSPFTIKNGEAKTFLKFKSFFKLNGTIDYKNVERFLQNLGLQAYDIDDEEIEESTSRAKGTSTSGAKRSTDRKKIRAEFPDGTVYCDNNVTQTFANTIEKVGIDRVRDLDIVRGHSNLIARDLTEVDKKYHERIRKSVLSNGYYLFTVLSTDDKLKILQDISKQTNSNIKLSLVSDSDENSD